MHHNADRTDHRGDLTELGKKYGIRDRTYAAGELKDPLNPLVAPSAAAEGKAREVLGELHGEFIRMVKESRGARLAGGEENLFTGAFWTGKRAQQLGLVDDNLGLQESLKQDCGADSYVLYEPQLKFSDLFTMLRSR